MKDVVRASSVWCRLDPGGVVEGRRRGQTRDDGGGAEREQKDDGS